MAVSNAPSTTARFCVFTNLILTDERSLRTQGKKGELARVDEDVEDQEMEI